MAAFGRLFHENQGIHPMDSPPIGVSHYGATNRRFVVNAGYAANR
jgi:hypothetical protein